MSRYIDIETIKPRQYENSEVELGVLAYDYDEVDAMPFLDIVRCRECRHWDTDWIPSGGDDDVHWCSWKDLVEYGDWFCADGEHKESE